jgi:glycosyltransferase involved in cell wall biosynthesis
MRGPLVSVIIPTFNREAIIGDAIQSALQQTYSNIEVVVVDDVSSDNTAGVLAKFGDQIRTVVQKNAGPSAARNRGLELARGELIAYLDSDDTWLPNKLSEQVRLLTALGSEVPCCLCSIALPHAPYGCPTSFALAGFRTPHDQGLWKNPTDVLLSRFVLFNQAVVVRRWAMEKAGPFKVNLRLLEDYDLSLRLSRLGPWAFTRSALVTYGIGESNSLSRWGHSDTGRIPRVMKQVLSEFQSLVRPNERRTLKLLRRQMRSCDYQIRASELESLPSAKSRQAARALRLYLRVRDAVFRRSPFWPRMLTESAELA